MALISRISRLFTADVHAVLDRIEEPEALLKQSIREMEIELTSGEQRLRALALEAERLAGREADSVRALELIEQELDVCFQSGEEDLAKTVVRKKLVETGCRERLTRQRGELEDVVAELARVLEKRRETLLDLQQKVDVLCRASVDTAGPASSAGAASNVRENDVEVAFLQEKSRRSAS